MTSFDLGCNWVQCNYEPLCNGIRLFLVFLLTCVEQDCIVDKTYSGMSTNVMLQMMSYVTHESIS